jgi:hypothetical protein
MLKLFFRNGTRLLLPEQFGLVGMLVIFMAVAQSFLDSFQPVSGCLSIFVRR